MTDLAFPQSGEGRSLGQRLALLLFFLVITAGAIYCIVHLLEDLEPVRQASWLPYALLGVALLIALGFEFVNGFHDTANAVATVIYTHSLTPNLAVVWSGAWNFIGVLVSSGAVAFGILQLLPVELIIGVGTTQGFAMVFALLIAAIIWNLGTWALGLPSSSSHTLIGSVIGVGLMNQMLHGTNGTSGVDWSQAMSVGKSLLFSPLVGFIAAGFLLYVLKLVVKVPSLYKEPEKNTPPPFWIRCLLILTCTGVSFAHGSNDGQKGMGLIMLILIGTVPTAYALNKAVTSDETQTFLSVSHHASEVLGRYANGAAPVADPRADVERFVQTKQLTPTTVVAVKQVVDLIDSQVRPNGSIAAVPQGIVNNVRNNMYIASEAMRLMEKQKTPAFAPDDTAVLDQLQARARSRDEVHPDLGQGRRGRRARTRDDGRLEADRGDRRRAHRQDASDVWTGRVGRTRRDADDRRRRRLRPARQHDARVVIGRRGDDGRQRLRPAMAYGAQSRARVDSDVACLDRAGGRAVLGVPRRLLKRSPRRLTKRSAKRAILAESCLFDPAPPLRPAAHSLPARGSRPCGTALAECWASIANQKVIAAAGHPPRGASSSRRMRMPAKSRDL